MQSSSHLAPGTQAVSLTEGPLRFQVIRRRRHCSPRRPLSRLTRTILWAVAFPNFCLPALPCSHSVRESPTSKAVSTSSPEKQVRFDHHLARRGPTRRSLILAQHARTACHVQTDGPNERIRSLTIPNDLIQHISPSAAAATTTSTTAASP